jgi:hypothetical protein
MIIIDKCLAHSILCVFDFRKLVIIAIKSDRHGWLQSVDDSLKSQPKPFVKCVGFLNEG